MKWQDMEREGAGLVEGTDPAMSGENGESHEKPLWG